MVHIWGVSILIVCCSPLSRTPPHQHHTPWSHTLHILKTTHITQVPITQEPDGASYDPSRRYRYGHWAVKHCLEEFTDKTNHTGNTYDANRLKQKQLNSALSINISSIGSLSLKTTKNDEECRYLTDVIHPSLSLPLPLPVPQAPQAPQADYNDNDNDNERGLGHNMLFRQRYVFK